MTPLALPSGPVECHHGLTIFNHYGRRLGCEVCADGPGECVSDWLVHKTAPDAKKVVKVDPDLFIAEMVAAGKMCPRCEQLREPLQGRPIGCECDRIEHHDQQMAQADLWLTSPAIEAELNGKAIAGHAFTSYARSARRAGLDQDSRQADRLDIIERHAVEPRWTKPQVNEADVLPV